MTSSPQPPPLAIKLKRINSTASTRPPSSLIGPSSVLGLGSTGGSSSVVRRSDTPRSQGTSNETRFKRRLIGLQNYGNICYCNVILQGLLSCEEYCRYWLRRSSSYYNPASEYKGSLIRSWLAFLREVYDAADGTTRDQFVGRSLQDLEVQDSCDTTTAPKSHREVVGSHRRLLELIRLHHPQQFPINVQGDAHEFLQVLLKGLSTETHRPPTGKKESSFDFRQRSELNSETEAMFRFHFVSEIQCLNCNRRRRRYEAEYEWDVDLPLPETPYENLEDLFFKSASDQQIVTLHCSKCKSEQPSCLRRRPYKLPEQFLCVQIKRFAYCRDSKQTYRLSTSIGLPKSKIIDFSVYCSGMNRGHENFELFGLTLQRGSLETGHYSGMYLVDRRTSFKHGSTSKPKWFYFSDEKVVGLSSSDLEAESDSIYLLWFRRTHEGWRASRSNDNVFSTK